MRENEYLWSKGLKEEYQVKVNNMCFKVHLDVSHMF